MTQCTYGKCKKKALFGTITEKKAIYCGDHHKKGMINIYDHRHCIEPGCYTQANFNYEDEKHPLYCKIHSLDGMVDVKNARCNELGCNIQPTFANKGDKVALYCLTHKKDGMVDVKHTLCAYKGCGTRPSFNIKGGKALYCVEHKSDDMVDVNNSKCHSCDKKASYNIKGQTKPLYCIDHKLTNMVNVKHKICAETGCTKKTSYGYERDRIATHCAEHNMDNMIRLTGAMCKGPNCDKYPVFNIKGDKKPLYCIDHKTKDMVDVKNKKCKFQGCTKQPSYNAKKQKSLYCKEHSSFGMVDVKRKTCLSCNKRPNYGTHISGRIYCIDHRDKKREWKLTNCCYNKNKKCKSIAVFSESGYYPYTHCELHAPSNLKSILTEKCITCNLDGLVDEEKKCLLTCSVMHKDRGKQSENEMNKVFEEHKFEFIRDTTLDDTCSRRRPDFTFNLGCGLLIVENDENQHKSRPCECEQIRMMQLYQESNGVPVHFIRFNPDRYACEDKKDDIIPLGKRFQLLVKIITNITTNKEKFFDKYKNLTVRYLYYDNYKNGDEKNILTIHM